MNRFVSFVQVSTLGLCLSSSLSAAPSASDDAVKPQSLALMQCTAGHAATEEVFYGLGLKFIGASQAIRSCHDWAKDHGADSSDCYIISCEEVQEPL